MDANHMNIPLMEMLGRPAFLVKDDMIVHTNAHAQGLLIATGEPVGQYLGRDLETFHQFQNGCLYLSIHLDNLPYGASVTKLGEYDLFVLDSLGNDAGRSMALCAQTLRSYLNNVYSVTDAVRDARKYSEVAKGLNQMHRTINNMADLIRYENMDGLHLETVELFSLFREIIEQAQATTAGHGISIRYTALPQTVIGQADRTLLERAVLNMISNAVKFSPKGAVVDAKLTRNEHSLIFTLTDQGDGIPPEVLSNIFTRYLREPSIEDGRRGVGLGLAIVRSAAIIHGGTVLFEQPAGGGTDRKSTRLNSSHAT